jgi:ATP-dependent RNA helicase DeaD
MNQRILGIAKKYLKDPYKIKIKAKELTVDKIEQISIELKQAMKDEALSRLIDINKPKKAVVFCNTKRKVDDLIESLKQKGYKAESLHGDIRQEQRERIMKRFKNGEFQLLVATDVVARGIDVDELELVVNYDVPQEEEYYVHRIGRTGRNGKIGKAYTFVVGKERVKLANIERYAHTKIATGKIPTDTEIKDIKREKVISNIQNVINEANYNDNEAINDVYQKLKENNSDETIIKALLELAVGNEITVKKISLGNVKKDKKGNVKFFLSLGKMDSIKIKDIVGSISSNTAISGSEIGKINVLDKFSFVEVPEKYAQDILNGMNGKKIKGKEVRIEVSEK